MGFVTTADSQPSLRPASDSWYKAPQRPSVRRAGRWLNSQAPQPVRPGQAAESWVSWRLPVTEAVELRRVTTTVDTAYPYFAPASQIRVRQIDISPAAFPVELTRFLVSSDAAPIKYGLSWTKGVQIPNASASPLPVELLKFTRHIDGQYPTYGQTDSSVQFRKILPFVRRAGRWISSQPYQPRTVAQSSIKPFEMILVPSGLLALELRKWVHGASIQPKPTEASSTRGIQIPNAAVASNNPEIRRWVTGADAQPKFSYDSLTWRPQIPTNADLYSAKRMIASFVGYRPRFAESSWAFYYLPIQDLPRLPIELERFVVTADSQPTQWGTTATWIPQLQPPVAFPEELERFIVGADAQPAFIGHSTVKGIQIDPVNPALPVELQNFLDTADAQMRQRGEPFLQWRYVTPVPLMPIELQKFLRTPDAARKIVPHSQWMSRKIDELQPMPMELRRFVETAFQRYRSHYLILRGNFEAVPVPDVTTEYLYVKGYTLIAKKVRVN